MSSIEVHYLNSFAIENIRERLTYEICNNTAIVCIGTDKCIVDSLGPLVGTILTEKLKDVDIDIYGTLENPVHALNLIENLKTINKKKYRKVIALDACLSSKKNEGIIEVRNNSIIPGKGLGKKLPEIGDISILGIVGHSDADFHDLIQNTHLSLIYDMSKIIAEGISQAIYKSLLMERCMA